MGRDCGACVNRYALSGADLAADTGRGNAGGALADRGLESAATLKPNVGGGGSRCRQRPGLPDHHGGVSPRRAPRRGACRGLGRPDELSLPPDTCSGSATSTQPFGRPPLSIHQEVDGFLARHSTLLSGGARTASSQVAHVARSLPPSSVMRKFCAGVSALNSTRQNRPRAPSLPPRLLPRQPRFG
jgi:hypothetical protein